MRHKDNLKSPFWDFRDSEEPGLKLLEAKG